MKRSLKIYASQDYFTQFYRALSTSDETEYVTLLLKNHVFQDFPAGPLVKNPHADAWDISSIPGPERFHMPRGNKAFVPKP